MAFWDLNTCRQAGMGIGPIPWLAVEAYCDRLGLDDEAREDMHALVRAMDDAFLFWCAKRTKGGSDGVSK